VAQDHAKQTGVALEKAYQFTLWLIPTVEKFPRNQKFLLGDRIETAALDVVEGIVDATYTRNRAPILEHPRRYPKCPLALELVPSRTQQCFASSVRGCPHQGRQ